MKKLMFLLVFCTLSISGAWAQKTFKGKVIGPDGLGLPGVNVVEKANPVNGAATDIDGNWTLSVPNENTILEFTAIGMKSIELAAKDALNLKMESDAQVLDEVMVVAYGTSKKAAFTGSATKVKGEKLELKNSSEITKALSGEVSGVQVIGGGGPGETAKIRIRGYGSVNANKGPLYILDGVPFDGDISSIDPSDIDSYTLLKDASSAALYGARGANGVILITTKKGRRGKSEIEINLKAGINTRLLPMYETIESPEEFTEMVWEGLANRLGRDKANDKLFNPTFGINPIYNMWNANSNKLIDPSTGKFYPEITRKYTPEKWSDNIFDSKGMYEVGVKFSGANEKSAHYTSFNFRDDKGYYIQSRFKRMNLRSNLSQQVKSWLKTGVNISYSYLEYSKPGQTSSMNNGFAFVDGMPCLFPVFERDSKGNKIEDELLGGYRYDYGKNIREFGGGINPAGALRLDKKKIEAHQISATPFLDIVFSEDWKFSTKLGVQYLMNDQNTLLNLFYGDSQGKGSVTKLEDQTLSYTWNQILSWNHSYDIHNLSALIGHEVNSYKFKRMYGEMSKLADPFNSELSNAVIKDNLYSYSNKYSLESYLAQVKYDYDGKYFMKLDYRRDGSSRFPYDKWGNFGSIGIAWLVSRENFMENVDWVNNLKLKISYGVLGNQDLQDIDGYTMYYPAYDDYSVENLNDELSLVTKRKGNKDLTWEQSKIFNAGIEFNISNTIEGSFEYFLKNTDNLLFLRDVPRSFGYAKLPVNSGKLQNSGIELELLAHVVNTDDWKFNINLNASKYNNELTEMPLGTDGKRVNLEQHGRFAYQKGRSMYDFYMRNYAGVNPETGSPKWTLFYDKVDGKKIAIHNMEQYKNSASVKERGGITELLEETTEEYDKATQYYLNKSVIPDLMGGFGFDLSYKGIRLAAQFGYSIGGYSYDNSYADLMHNKSNAGYNWSIDMRNRWKKPGDITDIPKLIAHSPNNNDKQVNAVSSRFLTSKSYISLNTVNISYSFPKTILEKLKLSELSLFASGDNLFLLSKRKGFNPIMYEDGRSNSYAYSPISTMSFGLRVKF